MRETQQESIVPKIKICGLTSVEEAAWVVEERVDYAGIVLFYSKSRRNMTITEAKELLPVIKKGRALSGKPILTVAVTVSPTPEQIEEIQAAGFDRIQVHGELSKESFDAIRIPMIRAFNGFDKEAYEKFHHCEKVEAYLFDAGKPGSGQIFDWSVLRQLPRDEKPIFLAGGLNADNIAQAIREVTPDVVDVSSGVERDVTIIPNKTISEQKTGNVFTELKQSGPVRVGKDREKIRVFVKAVRNVKALNWSELLRKPSQIQSSGDDGIRNPHRRGRNSDETYH